MRFDDRTILELKDMSNRLDGLLWKYSDVKSEENEFLRDMQLLIDGAILTSKQRKVEITIDIDDLINLKGMSKDKIIEYFINKHNDRW